MSSLSLYKGDCFPILESIPDSSVDLVVTDPPYEIATSGAGQILRKKHVQHYAGLKKMSEGFNEEVLHSLLRVMKKINMYIFCSKKQIIPLLKFFNVEENPNVYWTLITWHKTNALPLCCNKYLTDTEYCLFFREKGVPLYGTYDSKRTWYTTPLNQKDKKEFGHPTIKPIFIIKNFIINSSKPGDLVLDPYMGSGTTGVASIELQRSFTGIEIDEDYYHLAESRILQ